MDEKPGQRTRTTGFPKNYSWRKKLKCSQSDRWFPLSNSPSRINGMIDPATRIRTRDPVISAKSTVTCSNQLSYRRLCCKCIMGKPAQHTRTTGFPKSRKVPATRIRTRDPVISAKSTVTCSNQLSYRRCAELSKLAPPGLHQNHPENSFLSPVAACCCCCCCSFTLLTVHPKMGNGL